MALSVPFELPAAVRALFLVGAAFPTSACVAPRAPPAPRPVLVAAPASVGENVHAAPKSKPSAPRAPTEATAGAPACTLLEPVALGPLESGAPLVGFDSMGGLAVWKSAPGMLSVRLVSARGVPRGVAWNLALAEGVEPARVLVVPEGFRVMLRQWDWRRGGDAHWFEVSVERDAEPRPAVACSAPSDEQPASFSARVINTATPPPPGPRGTIYEAMPRPALVRQRGDTQVGQLTFLEVGGSPVGVHGLSVQPTIAWSGTHFVYAYADSTRTAKLLPVDCRP